VILTRLGRPPIIGDAVTYDHVRFVVVSIEGLGVKECTAELEEAGDTTGE